MIFYKQYDLPNQTTQPGTLANAKNRFHHHKARLQISNYVYSLAILGFQEHSQFLCLLGPDGGSHPQQCCRSCIRDIWSAIFRIRCQVF